MSPDLDRLALAVQLPGFGGTALARDVAGLLGEGLGGLCLFGGNTAEGPDAVRRLAEAAHAANPEAVVAVDEEGGDVTRLHDRTGSPVLGAAALGAVDDPELTRATGRTVGAELAAAGITLDLAPVADVNSNPDNPVIGTRSFHASPATAARHVAAWTAGLQEAGVAACLKHFPGHGDTGEDSHVALPVLDRDAEGLAERELVPFVAGIGSGAAAVMTSHIVVRPLDPVRPATLSRPVLDLLRVDLGYDGVVVTDALDMAGASRGRGIPEAAVLALAAGADLLCLGPGKDVALVRAVQAAVVSAVRAGRLPEERVAEAAARVRALRDRFRALPEPPPAWPPADGRRSLRVEGEVPPLAGARVLRLETPASIAVGEVPWGLPADATLTGEGDEGWCRLAAGPLVVQVRDAHRHPWVRDVVRRIAREAGGPVVVVEWGWPGPWEEPVTRVLTHGWSRPGAAAVTALLREAGWER